MKPRVGCRRLNVLVLLALFSAEGAAQVGYFGPVSVPDCARSAVSVSVSDSIYETRAAVSALSLLTDAGNPPTAFGLHEKITPDLETERQQELGETGDPSSSTVDKNTATATVPLHDAEVPKEGQTKRMSRKEAISTEFRREGEEISHALEFFTLCFLAASAVGFVIELLPVSLRPPVSIAHFAAGMLLFIIVERSNLGITSEVVLGVAEMHPNVMVYVLVPILLYSAASCTNWHVFNKIVWSALLLAILGVVFQIFVLGFVIWFFLTDETGRPFSFPWAAMIASILSATDPVAVVVALHELNAPEKLAALIEGESHLNDGSAAVFFILFRNMADRCHASSESSHPSEYLPEFLLLVAGGPAVGFVLAWTVCAWLRRFHQPSILEVVIVLSFVYVSFWFAEVIEVSGFLAICTYGIFFAAYGKVQLSQESQGTLRNAVKLLDCLATQALFVIAGIASAAFISLGPELAELSPAASSPERGPSAVQVEMEAQHHAFPLSHWGALFALYVSMMAARGLMVLCLSPFLIRLGYGFSWKEGTILWWGGLRGALGLALALSVFDDPECFGHQLRRETTFFVYGATALTLIMNGSTVGLLYKVLRPFPASAFRRDFLKEVLVSIDQRYEETKKQIVHHWLFKAHRVVEEAANAMVPVLRKAEIDENKKPMMKLPAITASLSCLNNPEAFEFVEGIKAHLPFMDQTEKRWDAQGHQPQMMHESSQASDSRAPLPAPLPPARQISSPTSPPKLPGPPRAGEGGRQKDETSAPHPNGHDHDHDVCRTWRPSVEESKVAQTFRAEGKRLSVEEDGYWSDDSAESEANDVMMKTLGGDHYPEGLRLGRRAFKRLASAQWGGTTDSPGLNLTLSPELKSVAAAQLNSPEQQKAQRVPPSVQAALTNPPPPPPASALSKKEKEKENVNYSPDRPPLPRPPLSRPSAPTSPERDRDGGLSVPLLSSGQQQLLRGPAARPQGSLSGPSLNLTSSLANVSVSIANEIAGLKQRKPASRHFCAVPQQAIGPSPSLYQIAEEDGQEGGAEGDAARVSFYAMYGPDSVINTSFLGRTSGATRATPSTAAGGAPGALPDIDEEATAMTGGGEAADPQVEFSRIEKECHLALILFQCCRQLYQNMYDDESITSGSLIDLQAAVDVAVDQIEGKLGAGVAGVEEERELKKSLGISASACPLASLPVIQTSGGRSGLAFQSGNGGVFLDPFEIEFSVLENRLDALSSSARWRSGWRQKIVSFFCFPLPAFLAERAEKWSQRRDFGKTLSALEQLIAFASAHDELEDFARDSGVWGLLSKDTKKSLKLTTKRVERVAERLYKENSRAYAEASCILGGRLLVKAKRKIVTRFVRRGLLEPEEEESLQTELLDVQLRRIRNYSP